MLIYLLLDTVQSRMSDEETTIAIYTKDKEVMDSLKVHPRESNKEVFHRIVELVKVVKK